MPASAGGELGPRLRTRGQGEGGGGPWWCFPGAKALFRDTGGLAPPCRGKASFFPATPDEVSAPFPRQMLVCVLVLFRSLRFFLPPEMLPYLIKYRGQGIGRLETRLFFLSLIAMFIKLWASLMTHVVKNPHAMQETQV